MRAQRSGMVQTEVRKTVIFTTTARLDRDICNIATVQVCLSSYFGICGVSASPHECGKLTYIVIRKHCFYHCLCRVTTMGT